MCGNVVLLSFFPLQSVLWKQWQYIAKWGLATGARGLAMIKRLEIGKETVSPDALRCLRGIHTNTAREAVLSAMTGHQRTLKDLRDVCKTCVYEQWADWQWRGAHMENLMDEDKRMHLLYLAELLFTSILASG